MLASIIISRCSESYGVQVGPNGIPLVWTPPFDVFGGVLAKLQSGSSARNIDRGGTGDRLRNIRFCELEAKQQRGRDFMNSFATMVLLRDERHCILLLRFAVCTRNLEVRRCTLGVVRDYGSPAAEFLVNATERAYKQFCTHRLGKPRTMAGFGGAGGE